MPLPRALRILALAGPYRPPAWPGARLRTVAADELSGALEAQDWDLVCTGMACALTPFQLVDAIAEHGRCACLAVCGLEDGPVRGALVEYCALRGLPAPLPLPAARGWHPAIGTVAAAARGMHAVTIRDADVLRRALRRDELEVRVLPQYRLQDGRPHGAELRLHWSHPGSGTLEGGHLLALAARHALDLPLLERLIDAAARILQAAPSDAAAPRLTLDLPLARAVSVDWAEALLQRLDARGIPRGCIVLGIGHGQTAPALGAALAHWRLRGVDCVASVDGGGGLALFAQAPVAALRLDDCLLPAMCAGGSHALSLLAGLCAGARSCGLHLSAGGIDTAAELAMARMLGCEIGQGVHLCAPMSEPHYSHYLAALEPGWRHPALHQIDRRPGIGAHARED